MEKTEFHKVIDDGRLLRIEEPFGSRVTVRVEGKYARLLSIYVPESLRHQGMAKKLLSLAEEEMQTRDIEVMDVAFSEEMWDVIECLENAGFVFSAGGDVISYDMADVVKIADSKNMLLCTVPGASYVTLADISEEEYKSMYGVLDRHGAFLTWDDMCTYSRDYSIVVFDKEKRPKAMAFSRLLDSELYVDLILSDRDTETTYVDMACQSLLTTVIEGIGIKSIEKVSGIISHKYMNRITEELGKMGLTQTKLCGSVYGKKLLKDITKTTDDYVDDVEEIENPELLWHMENGFINYQTGIGFKVSWMKRRGL